MTLFSSIINDLISKIGDGEKNKELISKEISDIININILTDQIKIKNNTIILNVSPTIKTSIILKKKLILNSLKKFNIADIK